MGRKPLALPRNAWGVVLSGVQSAASHFAERGLSWRFLIARMAAAARQIAKSTASTGSIGQPR
jgi:hypothetical protein